MKKFSRILSLVVVTLLMGVMPIKAETTVLKESAFDLIDSIINAEISYGLSGAQLVVMQDGEVIKQSAYGYTNSYENVFVDGKSVLDEVTVIPVEDRNPVTNDTLFDLASNTKMYAGNYAIQYLISRGELTLETKVVDIFPQYEYKGIGYNGQADLTIGHLLRHDSGFIASPKYHDNTFLGNLGNSGVENYLYTQDPEEILEILLLTPLEYEPGTFVRYSDVDFMLIGKIVEEVSGMTFDDFLNEKIYGPMGVSKVTFNPLDNGFGLNDVVSSELHGNTRDGRVIFNNYRDTVITGEVHDEKAYYTFDGLAGHAGLFGNAADIAKLAQLMLDCGTYNGITYFDQETIDDFSQASTLDDTYAYGWRRQGENKTYGWAFSEYASSNTLGHTGWTGTITQMDPDNDIVIVILTNSRNSPIMGPDKNDFFTKAFKTNGYGTITTLVYEALGFGSDFSATQFLTDLIETTIASSKNTASDRNSLRALYTVLKDLAIEDEVARDYVLENMETHLDLLRELLETDSTHLDTSFLEVDSSSLEKAIEKAQASTVTSETLSSYINYAKLVLTDNTATQSLVDAIELKLETLSNVDVPQDSENPLTPEVLPETGVGDYFYVYSSLIIAGLGFIMIKKNKYDFN